jgi:FtsP/CotA-like multicopper oxidase with cupredoxin domain
MMNKLKNIFFLLAFICAMSLPAQQRDFYLYSVMNGKTLLATGDSTWIWGYGYDLGHSNYTPITLPGPLLTVYLGDTVNVHFTNLSGEMHTIHLHGTDVDMMNDGSAHTVPPVGQNDSTTYSWHVEHPGSYFYHCHVMTVHHLQMGMYGYIVAKNFPDTTKLWTGGPGFNKEYSYIMSDMDTMSHINPLSPGEFHDFMPNYCMINGYADWMMFARPQQVIDAASGDSICLHLGNLGYTTVRLTFPQGSNATVYESDARILPQAFTADTLRIYPGERFEVILRPTNTLNGWIEVEYMDAILDDSVGTNYIGINQYVHPTGVNEIMHTNAGMSVYPNPAAGIFNVVTDEAGLLQIFTLDGKLVLTEQVVSGNNHLNISGVAAGIYIVRLGTRTQRIIITAAE